MVWADEFTIHLQGKPVRVWAPIGETVRQRLVTRRDCASLALAVDPICGTIDWQWQSHGQKERQRRARAARRCPHGGEPLAAMSWLDRLAEEGVVAIVWDGSGAHRDQSVQLHARQQGIRLLRQPPNAPELNPVERLIQVIRAATEGRVFHTIESKMVEVEGVLNELALDPEWVRQLTRWHWIHRSILALPP